MPSWSHCSGVGLLTCNTQGASMCLLENCHEEWLRCRRARQRQYAHSRLHAELVPLLWCCSMLTLGYMPSWSHCSGVGLLTCNTHGQLTDLTQSVTHGGSNVFQTALHCSFVDVFALNPTQSHGFDSILMYRDTVLKRERNTHTKHALSFLRTA